MKLPAILPALGLSAFFAIPSAAHEFWIEAEDYTLRPGDTLIATLRVGQGFRGASQAYLPVNTRRFELATGGETRAVTPRAGDRPALTTAAPPTGLVTLIHVTRHFSLEWSGWEEFTNFLRHKDAAWAIARHRSRGLAAAAGVREGYSRHAKALVAVGAGAGGDRAHGLETEIVALENPYTGATGDGLDIAVLYQGAPRPRAQVEVFARTPDAEGEVQVTTLRTDDAGRATVPVTPGTTYLLDAVVVRQPSAALLDRMEAEWETLWASLTFAIP